MSGRVKLCRHLERFPEGLLMTQASLPQIYDFLQIVPAYLLSASLRSLPGRNLATYAASIFTSFPV